SGPDCHQAAAPLGRTVSLPDLHTGRERRRFRSRRGGDGSLAFSPDGRRLVSAHAVPAAPREGEIKLFETAGGQELLSLKTNPIGLLAPSFSTDGTRLCAADVGVGTFFVWHTQPLTPDDVRRRDGAFLVRTLFARAPW